MSEGQERVTKKSSILSTLNPSIIREGDAFVLPFTLPLLLKRNAAFTLAEGAPHVAIPKNQCKAAFTLAEVLITLGIIGVVAALTMPSLISNYQKSVWVAQLEKDTNFVTNSIKRVLADEGIDDLCLSSLAECKYVGGDPMIYIVGEKFGKYFNLTEVPEDTLFSQATDKLGITGDEAAAKFIKAFYLNDGSCIATASSTGSGGDSNIGFFVDVNCDKKPNKWARDRFLIPYDFRYSGYDQVVQEAIDIVCKNDETIAQVDFFAGSFCFYKIMRDGWKMNY